jgi:hypothetical protein
MTRLKLVMGTFITYTAYYSALILCDHLRRKDVSAKNSDNTPETAQKPGDEMMVKDEWVKTEQRPGTLLVHDTVLRSLFAYDNSNHHSMVHFRFDQQTVDLLNKFKMATGVDNTKFAVFAVKYLFETNPELKTIIKKYIQNTQL